MIWEGGGIMGILFACRSCDPLEATDQFSTTPPIGGEGGGDVYADTGR